VCQSGKPTGVGAYLSAVCFKKWWTSEYSCSYGWTQFGLCFRVRFGLGRYVDGSQRRAQSPLGARLETLSPPHVPSSFLPFIFGILHLFVYFLVYFSRGTTGRVFPWTGVTLIRCDHGAGEHALLHGQSIMYTYTRLYLRLRCHSNLTRFAFSLFPSQPGICRFPSLNQVRMYFLLCIP